MPLAMLLALLINAINSGSPGAITEFANSSYASTYLNDSGGVDRAVRRWLEIHEVYGPIDVDSITSSDSTTLTAWARGRVSRSWLTFRLQLDTPDGKLVRVGLGRGLRPPYAAKRIPASADNLPKYLATYVESMAARDLFSGVVLVGRGDSILFERARGTTASSFDVASVGKMFTAIAIGQLAEQRKLTLDATIERYGSSLPAAIASRITVRQLLGHTSGLGELGPELDSAMVLTEHVSQMMKLLRDTTLHFAPGTKFEYSNRGYLALGEIIERESGENYFDYIKRHVFAPTGMTDSKFARSDSNDPTLAVRYSRFTTLRSAYAPGPRFATTARLDVRGGPAGGAFVSARDLFKFGRGVANGKLINATTRDLFTRASGEVPWGLGFELGANGAYGHRGGAPGATSYFFYLPAAGYTIVVLSNYDSAAQLVGDHIRELLER